MGWFVPPPKKPKKKESVLLRERRAKVEELIQNGLLKSQSIAQAMLKVQTGEPLLRRGIGTIVMKNSPCLSLGRMQPFPAPIAIHYFMNPWK